MTDQERLAELLGKDAWKIFTCGVCKDTHIVEFDGKLVECDYCDCEQSMTHFLKPPEELIEIAEKRWRGGRPNRTVAPLVFHNRAISRWYSFSTNFEYAVAKGKTELGARMACAIKGLTRMQAESATGEWVPTDNPSAPECDAK